MGSAENSFIKKKEKALEGISQAFNRPTSDDGGKVLFYIPVTKRWLYQVVLALIFICRASYQGVIEFLGDILDSSISKGTIHNIVHQHLEIAKQINEQQDLSNVQEGLHDEIYQAGDPVLVGCCARSTYCYLLSLVDSCDANSWGVNLLDLKEKQAFEVSLAYVLAVYELQGLSSSSQKRWQRQAELQRALGAKFYLVESLVDEGLKNTRRANSLVENINSRLRTYFKKRAWK